MRTHPMRRIGLFTLFLLLAVSLAGCAGGRESGKNKNLDKPKAVETE